MRRKDRGTAIRSALVGVVASGADLLALAALIGVMGLSPLWANVPALLLGLLVQFFGNKHFAFRDRSDDLVKQGTRFALVETGAFALNAGAFHLLTTLARAPYMVARLVGSALVYFGFSFPLWGRIFRAEGLTPAGAEE